MEEKDLLAILDPDLDEGRNEGDKSSKNDDNREEVIGSIAMLLRRLLSSPLLIREQRLYRMTNEAVSDETWTLSEGRLVGSLNSIMRRRRRRTRTPR